MVRIEENIFISIKVPTVDIHLLEVGINRTMPTNLPFGIYCDISPFYDDIRTNLLMLPKVFSALQFYSSPQYPLTHFSYVFFKEQVHVKKHGEHIISALIESNTVPKKYEF